MPCSTESSSPVAASLVSKGIRKGKQELRHAPNACGPERVGGEVNLVHVD
jgi:hypothetical protein